MKESVLIAGVGNIFLGDDAFGSVAARRMLRRRQRPGVKIIDLGIRGFDLAFALLENYDLVVLIDILPHSAKPGSLRVLEIEFPPQPNACEHASQTHGMTPVRALEFASHFGVNAKQLYVVGCEPESLLPNGSGEFSLTPAVEAAIEPALKLVGELVGEFFRKIGQEAGESNRQQASLCTS